MKKLLTTAALALAFTGSVSALESGAKIVTVLSNESKDISMGIVSSPTNHPPCEPQFAYTVKADDFPSKDGVAVKDHRQMRVDSMSVRRVDVQRTFYAQDGLFLNIADSSEIISDILTGNTLRIQLRSVETDQPAQIISFNLYGMADAVEQITTHCGNIIANAKENNSYFYREALCHLQFQLYRHY